MHLKSSSFKCDKESKMHSNISLTLTCTFYLENIVVVWKTERKNVYYLYKRMLEWLLKEIDYRKSPNKIHNTRKVCKTLKTDKGKIFVCHPKQWFDTSFGELIAVKCG